MNNQPMNVIPMVIESGTRGERAFDIYSLLLRERIVMLGMPINDQVANVIIAQLLYLEHINNINTPKITHQQPLHYKSPQH